MHIHDIHLIENSILGILIDALFLLVFLDNSEGSLLNNCTVLGTGFFLKSHEKFPSS